AARVAPVTGTGAGGRRPTHRGEELLEVRRRVAPLAARGPVHGDETLIGPLAQRRGADAEEVRGLAHVEKPLACFHFPFTWLTGRPKVPRTCYDQAFLRAGEARGNSVGRPAQAMHRFRYPNLC